MPAQPGAIIIVPDQLWMSETWAGMLAGAAARGVRVQIIAPAQANAPIPDAPAMARAHDVLLCIGSGKTVNDENRLKYGTPNFYVRSPEEMWRIFGDELPETLQRNRLLPRARDGQLILRAGKGRMGAGERRIRGGTFSRGG